MNIIGLLKDSPIFFKEISMNKDRHARVEVGCENCGDLFLARKERVEQGMGKFCSKKCYDEW